MEQGSQQKMLRGRDPSTDFLKLELFYFAMAMPRKMIFLPAQEEMGQILDGGLTRRKMVRLHFAHQRACVPRPAAWASGCGAQHATRLQQNHGKAVISVFHFRG